jgi:peptide/nickel transport system permease protein
VGIATFARYQRSSMADAYGQPFVRTARASGLSPRRIRRAAWRAALSPVITMGGLLLPGWLAGVVFIEQIYAWPGMGFVMLQAIGAHDYAVVAGAVIIGSGMTSLAAAGADLLQAVADPRLRIGLVDAPSDMSRGTPR